jgi:hypothetical protein
MLQQIYYNVYGTEVSAAVWCYYDHSVTCNMNANIS